MPYCCHSDKKNWRQKIKLIKKLSINIRTLCEIFHRDALFHFKILLSMTVEHVEFSKTPSSPANWVTDRVDHGWTPLSPPPMPQALPLPAMVRYAGCFWKLPHFVYVRYNFLVVECNGICCMFSGGGECASSGSVLLDCKDRQPSQLLQRWCDHSSGAAGELVAGRTQWG